MAVPAPAKVARGLAASAAALVLLWCVHFRGGLSFGSPANKGLIFNVRLFSVISSRGCSIPIDPPGPLGWTDFDWRDRIHSISSRILGASAPLANGDLPCSLLWFTHHRRESTYLSSL
jgi:hypothetical protein